MAKLTEGAVFDLRKRALAGESLSSLAAELGVGYSAVYKAVRGLSWEGVPFPEAPDASPSTLMPLTAEIVAQARKDALEGACISSLSEELRVSYSALYQAVRGKSWIRVTDPPPVGASPMRTKGRTLNRTRPHNGALTAKEVTGLRKRASKDPFFNLKQAWREEGYQARGLSYGGVSDAVRGVSWARLPQPAVVRRLGKNCKMSEDQVSEARLRAASGGDWKALSAQWGVAREVLKRAIAGETWGSLLDPPPFPGVRRS
jgi:hypothetical protein